MNNYCFKFNSAQILNISGDDAADFLGRLSTISFKTWEPWMVKSGAFLTGKATAIALFIAWKEAETFRLYIESECNSGDCWNYLQKMHFSEKLNLKQDILNVYEVIEKNQTHSLGLKVIPFQRGSLKMCLALDEPVGTLISEKQWYHLMANYGIPRWGVDFSQDSLFLEAPYESYIDRNKGCYPGQEVIEKIYTYGRLPKKIFRLKTTKYEEVEWPLLPQEICVDGENVGRLTSLYSEVRGVFGFATLKKNFSDKTLNFHFLNKNWSVENI